ncbi:MAG: hypothetical protein M1839_005196 [Geoglossum umbratile]|nr:MAG: hypothetical protein M1839_005196 [Geoglossum umbratile]
MDDEMLRPLTRSEAFETELPHLSSDIPGSGGFSLKRFWIRAIVCILAPPVITGYYIWTWNTWLRPSSNPYGSKNPRPPDARTVNYSWFLIGAIGPELSKYCLSGIEAGMLMERRWGAKNALQVMLHCDKGWAGIDGWAGLFEMIRGFPHRRRVSSPTVLWTILFALSVLSSFGFILSGLSMELGDAGGWVVGTTPGAEVLGLNRTNIDTRQTAPTMRRAIYRWTSGINPQLTLGAALYANDSGSTALNINISTRNDLPMALGSPIFLAPQAAWPLTGTTDGLLIQYNCSIVRNSDDFTILSMRNHSATPFTPGDNFYYEVGHNGTIFTLNATRQPTFSEVGNIRAYALVGTDIRFLDSVRNNTYPRKPNPSRQEYVLEYLLWQGSKTIGNLTVGGIHQPIDELEGEYRWKDDTPGPDIPMSAIGARCTSSSAFGSAEINGLAGTFTDFHYNVPQLSFDGMGIPRFEIGVPLVVVNCTTPALYGLPPNDTSWLYSLLTTAEVPIVLTEDGLGAYEYTSLLQPEDLQYALARAYQTYALQLMYDGEESLRFSYFNLNLTAARPAKTLKAGKLPPLLILSFLSIWTLGCGILGACYGFKKRWAETLDGYSLFCFGTDVQRQQKSQVVCLVDYKRSKVLSTIPGLIGDSQPNFSPGHISLVPRTARNVALVSKKYN